MIIFLIEGCRSLACFTTNPIANTLHIWYYFLPPSLWMSRGFLKQWIFVELTLFLRLKKSSELFISQLGPIIYGLYMLCCNHRWKLFERQTRSVVGVEGKKENTSYNTGNKNLEGMKKIYRIRTKLYSGSGRKRVAEKTESRTRHYGNSSQPHHFTKATNIMQKKRAWIDFNSLILLQ